VKLWAEEIDLGREQAQAIWVRDDALLVLHVEGLGTQIGVRGWGMMLNSTSPWKAEIVSWKGTAQRQICPYLMVSCRSPCLLPSLAWTNAGCTDLSSRGIWEIVERRMKVIQMLCSCESGPLASPYTSSAIRGRLRACPPAVPSMRGLWLLSPKRPDRSFFTTT
jgi:hypothetical protein